MKNRKLLIVPLIFALASYLYGSGGGGFGGGSGGGGTGTVTVVGLSLPSFITVSGSPVTNAGYISGSLANQSANNVFIGPTSGGATPPTFRNLVGADLPNPSSSALGGTQSAAAVSNQWINSISTSGVPALSQPAFTNLSGNISTSQMNSGAAATNSTYWRGDGTWAAVAGGAGGTVTSVGLSLPGIFTVNGSPVTAAGVITGALATQSANVVFAGPTSGGAVAPAFRSLVTADFPSPAFSFAQISGNLAVAQLNSGTNADATHYWRGDGTWATVSGGGSGITSINGDATAAQLIAGSNNISCSTTSGTTTCSGASLAPKASPTFSGTIGTALAASSNVLTDGSGNLSTGIPSVSQGGTGIASAAAYSVLAGGTTSTGALQTVSGVGSSGQVLTSNGAATLPTWQTASASVAWGAITGTLSSQSDLNSTLAGKAPLDSPAITTLATINGGSRGPKGLGLKGAASSTLGGTTTMNLSGTVTQSTMTGSGTSFLTGLAEGDQVSLSSAASTKCYVIAVNSNTDATLSCGLGNGTSQTINRYPSTFRSDPSGSTGGAGVDADGNFYIPEGGKLIFGGPNAFIQNFQTTRATNLRLTGSSTVYLADTAGTSVFQVDTGTTGATREVQVKTDLIFNGDNTFDIGQGQEEVLGNNFRPRDIYVGTSIKNGSPVTTINGAAGTAKCSQPERGSSYKKVVCYLSGFTNTSDVYTFPVAFTNSPYEYGTAVATAVSTQSTTTITIAGATTVTGWVFLEGY